jgi:hypothetical protein
MLGAARMHPKRTAATYGMRLVMEASSVEIGKSVLERIVVFFICPVVVLHGR